MLTSFPLGSTPSRRVEARTSCGNEGKERAKVRRVEIEREEEEKMKTHRTDVVGTLSSVLGSPGDVVLVGEDGSDQGRSVVSSKTDEHESGER